MKLVWPSAKLLQAAAGTSLRACHHVTRSVLPLLLEQYTKHPQVRGTPALCSQSRAQCRAWWEQGVQWAPFHGCRWGPHGYLLALRALD